MKANSWGRAVRIILLVGMAMVTAGCVTVPKLPPPAELACPEPIKGNTGEYMCPYTSDDVLAGWVDKAVSAKAGATVGKMAGAYAGQQAMGQIPFVGGLLGSKAGEAIGREAAISMSGGWDNIKETSDISFDSVNDMAVYIYVKHSSNEHYNDAIKATSEIYPKFGKTYMASIQKAARK